MSKLRINVRVVAKRVEAMSALRRAYCTNEAGVGKAGAKTRVNILKKSMSSWFNLVGFGSDVNPIGSSGRPGDLNGNRTVRIADDHLSRLTGNAIG